MIKVKQLTKCYGQVKAVDSIDFEVAKGEIVGFLGPNGAGFDPEFEAAPHDSALDPHSAGG